MFPLKHKYNKNAMSYMHLECLKGLTRQSSRQFAVASRSNNQKQISMRGEDITNSPIFEIKLLHQQVLPHLPTRNIVPWSNVYFKDNFILTCLASFSFYLTGNTLLFFISYSCNYMRYITISFNYGDV